MPQAARETEKISEANLLTLGVHCIILSSCFGLAQATLAGL